MSEVRTEPVQARHILNKREFFNGRIAGSFRVDLPENGRSRTMPTDTSNEACAVACMLVSNPGDGPRKAGWQKQVNDLIRALRDELDEAYAFPAANDRLGEIRNLAKSVREESRGLDTFSYPRLVDAINDLCAALSMEQS